MIRTIASTSVSLDHTVATVNMRDVEKIPGVKMQSFIIPTEGM